MAKKQKEIPPIVPPKGTIIIRGRNYANTANDVNIRHLPDINPKEEFDHWTPVGPAATPHSIIEHGPVTVNGVNFIPVLSSISVVDVNGTIVGARISDPSTTVISIIYTLEASKRKKRPAKKTSKKPAQKK